MDLYWEIASFEGWRIYLLIFAIAFIAAATDFNEVKRRNKIILAVIGILTLLTLPLVRRLNVKHLVEKDGYAFIIQDGLFGVNKIYQEADPDDHIWKIFGPRDSFYCEHEHKLIFFDDGIIDIYPGTLDEIRFYDREGKQ